MPVIPVNELNHTHSPIMKELKAQITTGINHSGLRIVIQETLASQNLL